MPGVLIVEAMAQAAGALVVHSLGGANMEKIVYFMTIDKARFRHPVVPGDLLIIPVPEAVE
jgi:3-hydroxyacyl-[acyl-carrier-protein] dehydratase